MEQDSSSMEKRFCYKFLKRLLQYVDSAQEFIAHLGECDIVKTDGVLARPLQRTNLGSSLSCGLFPHPEAMATSGKTDKSPHDQEIKFFAKVWRLGSTYSHTSHEILLQSTLSLIEMVSPSRSCSLSQTRRLKTTVCTSCPRPART